MKENPLGIQYEVELVFALLPNLTLSTSRVVKVLWHMNALVIGSIQVASRSVVGPLA